MGVTRHSGPEKALYLDSLFLGGLVGSVVGFKLLAADPRFFLGQLLVYLRIDQVLHVAVIKECANVIAALRGVGKGRNHVVMRRGEFSGQREVLGFKHDGTLLIKLDQHPRASAGVVEEARVRIYFDEQEAEFTGCRRTTGEQIVRHLKICIG